MKKLVIILAVLMPFSLFAKGFDQYIFAPHIGMTGGVNIHQSLYANKMFVRETMVGPTLGLDMVFNMKKNGFTFMFNNNFMPVFILEYNNDPYQPDTLGKPGKAGGFGMIGYFEFLFGYTHGLGTNFELMFGVGPAYLWPLVPAINLRLSGGYYFNRKYGLFFALGNSFGVLDAGTAYGTGKSSWILNNVTSISFGPIFRLR